MVVWAKLCEFVCGLYVAILMSICIGNTYAFVNRQQRL